MKAFWKTVAMAVVGGALQGASQTITNPTGPINFKALGGGALTGAIVTASAYLLKPPAFKPEDLESEAAPKSKEPKD